AAIAADQDSNLVVNGGFEDGLKGWQTTGDVHLETNRPLAGKASAIIGPGAGSLTQRIKTGSGNPLSVSATIQSPRTNGWVLAVRFLDKKGREVMRVDSLSDMKGDGQNPRKFNHYMEAHPLTKWAEIIISKDSSGGSVLVDQVGLDMPDENAASLKPACNLDQAMQPFWLGNKVYDEAVLMLSRDGKPATGQLMFHPSRIISVRDYGLATNYVEGLDYSVDGRTLVCTASSRMPQARDEDLLKGEFKWNVIGGKQVMVTYEHEDTWNHPYPAFVGAGLPNTMKHLRAHAPLIVVAYGDSITHGYGESRLSHIRPFLPPWPELFVRRLKTIYHDQHIQLYNSSQSGATSQWGKDYAERMVASLNPDLVIIAFGQNDFWSIPAGPFADNITDIMKTVRNKTPNAEFLLVSTLRFDPAYTPNAQYWNLVGEYAKKLNALTGPGVQFVDMTAISEWVYAAKKPMDCLNDPLHPNDYFARGYAQSVVAALDPALNRSQ
ncbi:MAG TPA: SGNH/GDSL hydrolase family protein, partial [Candidatus Nitrosopolaris sp.]|nr:SGNH/GDSL hydrolase family protein [Candidatus Nitrosopolaris sp.]